MRAVQDRHLSWNGNRKNSYELFGYDIMIDDRLNVWLIEVNWNPAMGSSGIEYLETLIGQMLTDMAKVVVDWDDDKSAETGSWELL